MGNSCSFYGSNKFPKEQDIVIAKTTELTDVGLLMILPEYKNKIGFLLFKDVEYQRVKRKFKENMIYVCRVVRVDEEKGYIDVSKLKILEKELSEQYLQRYRKAQIK
eukprot:gene5423-6765_t